MTAVHWTERAHADLVSIAQYLEQASPSAAYLQIERILLSVRRLHDFPESGRIPPEPALRRFREVIAGQYRVVYRIVDADTVHILAVRHGARRMPRDLFD